MGLVSLHTRLTALLAEAQDVRRTAVDAEATLGAGAVSVNAVVGLAQRFASVLANTVADAEGDTALKDYAAAQFAGQPWVPLDQQVAGVKALLQAAIAACIAAVPKTAENVILKDTLNNDGTVSVATLSTVQTANVRAAMTAIRSAIPE